MTACPACKGVAIRHCEARYPTCDLVRCTECGHYGTPDMRRWAKVWKPTP